MNWLVFVVLALASFRISRLIISDTITDPARSWLLSRWPAQDVAYDAGDKVRGGTFQMSGKLYANDPTWIGDRLAKLVGCYACAGFWISTAVFLSWALWPVTFWGAVPFAISTVVWFLALIQDRLE